MLQFIISTPLITCPASKKCPSFSLEFKISEEILYRKNYTKYKDKRSRRTKTWWDLADIHHFKGTLLFHTVTNKPSANPGLNPNVTKEWDTRKSHFSLHLYNNQYTKFAWVPCRRVRAKHSRLLSFSYHCGWRWTRGSGDQNATITNILVLCVWVKCMFTPCKGIRILKSNKIFPCGMQEIFYCAVWNPEHWNPGCSSRNPE